MQTREVGNGVAHVEVDLSDGVQVADVAVHPEVQVPHVEVLGPGADGRVAGRFEVADDQLVAQQPELIAHGAVVESQEVVGAATDLRKDLVEGQELLEVLALASEEPGVL